ncbi:FAD-binding oxidoreductase [Sulfitobacter sp. TSTF-M16]|uniref:FAD-binding oxidoreductase n=1 Tax=Sulfitobacter aestuariivivens TaxID=2766981 RepID=A0A927D2G9_9RHOB|nr:FAD-binding oxidoreductase [Sulfitobacter aestuariivivens]MBD3663815.1 FAD-binding oxidoreductase [Sulfitobacter aestuariivivens]
MTLRPADIDFEQRLRADLPEDILRPMEPRYLHEPRGRWQGQSGLLACPRTVEDVAKLIRHADAAKVGVVPYGGGTGLVGGQVVPEGPAPLLLSLERMNQVRAVYPQENVITVEAGTILADVQAAAVEAERVFPLSLAAEGSATIGGNLATNAGGTGVLRYGNARELSLGLEAVLPDGQIWNGLTRLRKNNTGYDLRHLLIGSEGTLGVITAATLKLFARPKSQATAMLVVDSPQAALSLLSMARDHFGEMVSAFELIHRQGLVFLEEVLPDVRLPFVGLPEWCVLIELGLSGKGTAQDALETLFEVALEADLTSDGVIAQSDAQSQDLWRVREYIPEANRLIGSIASHDISVPLGALSDFIATADRRIAALGPFRINCFGHVGDGNLHYNIFPPAGESRDTYASMSTEIQGTVHQLADELGGAISAEHGIGRFKVADLERYGDPAKLAAMRAIKSALDPKGIMNPGAVLRD